MKVENNNHFAELIPKTPYRTFHILVSILAVVVVIGTITAYQINKVEKSEDIKRPVQIDLTTEQRSQAISELEKVVSKSTPLTDKERARAIDEMKRSIIK